MAIFELKVTSTAPALASVIAWISMFEVAAFEVIEIGVRVRSMARADKKARRVRKVETRPSNLKRKITP